MNFKKIEVKLDEEMVSRLQKLSEILNISMGKIINASLLEGILPYWIPYQQILTEISNKENPITEEDYQDAIDVLSTGLNSGLEILERVDARESEFESLYPFGYFKDLEERKTEFIKFLKVNRAIKPEEPEQEIDLPIQEKVIDTPSDNRLVEEEEDVSPSLFSRVFSYSKAQIKSKVTNFKDITVHGEFLGILALLNFSIFYSIYLTWPYLFNFTFMLETFPLWQTLLSTVFIIILIPIMFILTGFLTGKVYYYLYRKEMFLFYVKLFIFPLRPLFYLGNRVTTHIFSRIKLM